MIDKELLELAAKAAEMNVVGFNRKFNALECTNLPGFQLYWAPLTDDGDAFRLAVKLGIPIGRATLDGVEFATAAFDDGEIWEPLDSDPYAATRRAIVRAAAELGKAKS